MENKKQILRDFLIIVITSILSVAIVMLAINYGYIKIPASNNEDSPENSSFIDAVSKARSATVSVFCDYDSVNASCGSGVVLEYDKNTNTAYVITNHHVINGVKEDQIQIFSLLENKLKPATLIGTDPECDIAVLAFNPSTLPVCAEIGRSLDQLSVGEEVFAVGAPLGLYDTTTTGIISTIGRLYDVNGIYKTYIQTSALINPGNSGGGLFDANGKLIAINTLGFSNYAGLNLSLPVLYDKNVSINNTNYNIKKADALTSYNALIKSHKALALQESDNLIGFIPNQKTVGALFETLAITDEETQYNYVYVESVFDFISPSSTDKFVEAGSIETDSNKIYVDCITKIECGARSLTINTSSDSPAVDVYEFINKCEIGSSLTFSVTTNFIDYNTNTFNKTTNTKTVTVVLAQFQYQFPN